MNQPSICTIISKNYLAHARVLAKTFLHHHLNGQVFVLLVDEIDSYFDPEVEPFTTILVKDLGIPNFSTMTFRYTVLELNTAVKPYFLEYLFAKYDLDKLCFFDPDITINHPLDEIFNLLGHNLMVLVPHLLDFLEDGYQPDEQYILRAGTYNLGFIGIARHPELSRFLHWWQRRLEKHCMVDTARGLFTDQRWIDLAPGLFDDVYIHRDPGCDVAYWNLNHRQVTQTEYGYAVNDSPLKFFHFSGISVENLEAISKHQNRYTLTNVPHLRPIYEQYRDLLIEYGYFTIKDWPYAYDQFYFDNTLKVPNVIRLIWRKVDEEQPGRWTDPLFTGGQDTFLAWLNQSVDKPAIDQPIITNLGLGIYNLRVDLQKAFPDPLRVNRWAYAEWFVHSTEQDHQLDYDIFIKLVADSLTQARQAQVTVLRHELTTTQAALQAREQDLNVIYNSRTWRVAKRIQRVYHLFKKLVVKPI